MVDRDTNAERVDEPPAAHLIRSDGPAEVVERLKIWVRWIGMSRLLAGAGVVILVAALGWWLLRSPPTPTEARLSSAEHVVAPTTAPGAVGSLATPPTTQARVVVVHIAGEVVAPGVYELPGGARVADAIEAAGGVTPTADPNALNLAAPLHDGDRIEVAAHGAAPVAAGGGVTHAGGDGAAAVGPVNINTASVDELDELPGIGPATATAIVAHRDEHGPFATVDDLELVPGIGPAKLATIRPLVTV